MLAGNPWGVDFSEILRMHACFGNPRTHERLCYAGLKITALALICSMHHITSLPEM